MSVADKHIGTEDYVDIGRTYAGATEAWHERGGELHDRRMRRILWKHEDKLLMDLHLHDLSTCVGGTCALAATARGLPKALTVRTATNTRRPHHHSSTSKSGDSYDDLRRHRSHWGNPSGGSGPMDPGGTGQKMCSRWTADPGEAMEATLTKTSDSMQETWGKLAHIFPLRLLRMILGDRDKEEDKVNVRDQLKSDLPLLRQDHTANAWRRPGVTK